MPHRNEREGVWYYDIEAVQPVNELEIRPSRRWYAFGGPVGGFGSFEEAQEFARRRRRGQ